MPSDTPNMFDGALPRIPRRNSRGDDETVIDRDGNTIPADESITTSGGEIIPTDESVICEGCDDVYHQDDDEIAIAYTDAYYRRDRVSSCRCENCRTQCADCNEYFTELNSNNSSDEPICTICSENYTSCESCDCIIHSDDSRYDDEDELTLCPSCYANRERNDSRGGVHDHEYKPAPKFLTVATDKAVKEFYGVEFECEDMAGYGVGHALKDSGLPADCFYPKRDGSLHNGVEIVSHPASYNWWMAHDFKWAEYLKKQGFRAYDTKTCGQHIHVSKSALSESQQAKLLLFARENRKFFLFLSRREDEKALDEWSGIENRPTGHFVKRIAGRKKLEELEKRYNDVYNGHYGTPRLNTKAELIAAQLAYTELSAEMRNVHQDDRYVAINLNNEHTIEFRLFRGTLNVPSIRRNIAIVRALVAYVRQSSHRGLSTLAFVRWLETEGRYVVGKNMAAILFKWVDSYLNGAIRPESEAA